MSPKASNNQINFDLLFKNNPLPMWIYDIQSLAFLEVNDAAVKKYGYSRKKFLSMTLKNIRPKEDVERLIKDVSKKRPALQQSRNWRHILKSGKVIDVEITSHTIKYNERKAALVTARDITDQKLAGEKINKLNKVYSILSEVNQTIVRTRNANELFKSICRIAVNKGGFAMAWIGMLDKKDNKVKVVSSAGNAKDYLKKINIVLNDKKQGSGPTGLAIKTGKHFISNNIEKDKRMLLWKKDAIKYGFRSSASFPIKVFGKVIGSFSCYSSQLFFFNDEEIKLLDELVMDLDFALEFIEKEKERREAEGKLKLTQFGIDHSQIAVFQIDEEGNIYYVNEQAYKSLGYTYSELSKMNIIEIDPTFTLKKWKEHRKNIRKEGSGTIETIHKRKDGSEFFVEVSINYFDFEGKKLSFSFAKDITERKIAEKALRESEENLSITLHSIGDAVISTDNKGLINKMNPTAEKLCGWKIHDAIGKPLHEIFDIINADSRIAIDSPFEKVIKTGKTVGLANHTILISRDGSERNIADSAAPIKDSDGKIVGVVLVFSDVTEAYKTRKELQESEQLLKESQKIARLGSYVWDLSKGFWSSSEILDDIFGIDKNYIRSLEGWAALVHPDWRETMNKYVMEEVIGKRKRFDIEYKIIRIKDGRERWIHGLGELELDNKKQPVKLKGTISDITERKRTEETLQKRENELRVIIESTADGILAVDQNGKIIKTNNRFSELWRIPQTILESGDDNDLLNFVLNQLVDPEQFLKKVRLLYNSKDEDFDTILFKDDRTFERYSAPLIVDNKVLGRVWSFRDITERKLAEEKLLESEKKFRSVWKKSTDGMRITNEEGLVILANDAYCRLGEKPLDEIEGKPMSVIQDRSRRNEIILKHKARFLSQSVPSYLEKKITLWNGKEKYIELSNTFLEIEHQPALLLSVFRDVTERKRAEQTLRESEERFRNLVENINEVFYISDGQGRIEYCSPNSFTSIGYTAQDILGKSYLRLVAPIDRRLVIDHYLEQTAKGVSNTQLIFRVRCKDGKIIWVEQITNIVRDTSGKVVGFRNVARDITLRKLAEEDLRESKEELQKFFEDDLSADFIATPAGQILNCNKTFLKLFGFRSKEEALAFPIEKLYPQSSSRSVFIDTLRRNKKIENFEEEYVTNDGRIIYTIENAIGEFDAEGKLAQIRGYIVDITERKKAEEELKKQSRAVEQSPASVIITNQNGDIEYVNEKFCKITGYSREEVIGKNPRILKSGQHDKNFYADLWDHILSGKEWKGEMRNKKKNGDLFWESVLISPLVNNEGDITHFVAVKEDITEKKIMIEELINAKEKAESANKLKDAFIANMSHEIRTPLNGILGLSEIIKDKYTDRIKAEDEILFAGIEHSSKRIIRTVDMILNYSRIQTGEFPVSPKKIDINSICNNLVKEFNTAAKSKSLELSFENKIDKTPLILGDEYSITEAISNLIDNAIKYTNHGSVGVALYIGNDDEILLDIKDSGIGISEDYIQHIFDPYQQEQMGYGRAYEGVGLGLPIVKKFLDLNNAAISVVSKKEKGTTFTINLGRLIESTAEKLTEEKIIKNVLLQGKENKPLVLIVEDDVINQSTIKRFISPGYSAVVTDNSERALEFLKTNKIDLILMDISIKGNKNGLELTKELKSSKEYSHISVIAITAHAFDKDRQNALDAGCDDYLSKPFSKKLLLDTIGKFV